MTERVKFDLDMMKWVVSKIKEQDYSAFPFEYEGCEKCGAGYLPEFGHDCNNTIELDMHIPEDDDEIELITNED